MRKTFCLLFVISFFVFILGCDEDIALEEPPKVVGVSVEEGPVFSFYPITVTFSREMESVEISVSSSSCPATTTLDSTRKIATWRQFYVPPGLDEEWAIPLLMPVGKHTLMVTGTDILGRQLEGFTPIDFEVVPDD